MRTLYYKVQVTQYLHNYNRVEIYTIEYHDSDDVYKLQREANVRSAAISKMVAQYGCGDDDMWKAEILEIIET